MAEPSKVDELLEKARRLKEQTGTPANDKGFKGQIKGSVIGDTLNNVKAINATAEEVKGGATFFKELGLTIYNFLKKSWPGRAYAWAFKKICYKKDKQTGEKHLSKKRAGAMILTTAFMATAVIPGMIGSPARTVIDTVTEPIYDGAMMATTMQKEVVYLNNKHLVSHSDNEWVASGTVDKFGGSNESLLYLVKPSLANDIWHWKNKGNPFFIPDQITSPISPGNSQAYVVTSYGWQRWRVAKWLQAYPILLDAQPVTDQQAAAFNAAVKAGQNPFTIKVQSEAAAPTTQTQAPTPAAPAPAR